MRRGWVASAVQPTFPFPRKAAEVDHLW